MMHNTGFLLVIAGLLHFLVDSALTDCRDSFFLLANSSSELAFLFSASGGLKYADVGLYDACHDHETTEYCSTSPDYGYCYPAACDEEDFSSSALLNDLNYGIVFPPKAAELLGEVISLACPAQCLEGGCQVSCLDPAVFERVKTIVTTAAEMLLGASEAWSSIAPRQAVSFSSISSSLFAALQNPAPATILYSESSVLQKTISEINYSPDGFFWLTTAVIGPLTTIQSLNVPLICGDNRVEAGTGSYIMLGVLGLFAFLVIAATWLAEERAKQEEQELDDDIVASRYYALSHDLEPGMEEEDQREGSLGGIAEATVTSPLLARDNNCHHHEGRAEGEEQEQQGSPPAPPELDEIAYGDGGAPAPPSVGERMLLCFDLAASGRALLCTDRSAGHFSCFDGIRALSMLWVVLGHTLVWEIFSTFDNPQKVYPSEGMAGSWGGQLIVNGEFGVDSFFFMAGFLGAYLGLKKLCGGTSVEPAPAPAPVPAPAPAPDPDPDPDPVPSGSWVCKAVGLRWLRLTPLLMFVTMLDTYVVDVVGSGPLWYYHSATVGACKDHWWANLLYINNLFPWENPGDCYGVTWYLANDMQFFLLTPPVILAYIRSPALGKALVAVATLASMAVGLYLVLAEDMSAVSIKGDDTYHRDFYIKPWTRLPAYSIGVGMGMLWWERGGRKFSSRVAVVLAFISCGLLVCTVFGTYRAYHYLDPTSLQPGHAWNWGRWTRTEDVLYAVFSRPAWAAGLGILSTLCFTNQAWLVGRFLNSTLWIPLSRLSYAIYLAHPMVLSLINFTARRSATYTLFSYSAAYLSAVTGSILVAIALFLLVERPAANLVHLLFTRGGGGGGGGRSS